MLRVKMKNLVNKLILIALVIALGLLTYVAIQLPSEGTQCLLNPLVYGAKQVKQDNNAELFCSCNLDKPNSPIIRFTSESMSVERIGFGRPINPVFGMNISDLFKNITIGE